MASSFSDLGIELMATGENAGTWGTKTNTNLQIVEKAVAGYVEQAVTSGGTTALTITDGDATESTSVARHAVIKLTGTITGNSIVTVPDSIEKVYIVTNGTSGAYTVQFKTASGTGITFGVSEKTTRLVYSDGTNLVDAGFGGSLDIEGRELVLDADGDTTITADTDDQIDIKIAGADDFQFTANTFTAQSGSSIVVPEGGLTFGSTAITSTAAELNLLDGVSGLVQADLTKLAALDATAAELNIVDGGTSATSTTVADADRVVLNDNGTMVQVAVTDLAAYFDDEITAMPNLTSVGTLTTLTVDSIIINGTNIGHTSDADALAIDSSGNVTASQNLIVTGDLTVSGDDITMGTNTAGNLLVADGTNFNSIAVSSLSEISSVANDDVFLAIDTSGGGLKKIARSAVVSGLATSAAISNVVEDTSPQLGGDLDTNSANILIDDAHFIADENGNEQIIFQTTSSAVNQFDVTNAATGNAPKLEATGGDSNIDLEIEAKGTGHVTIRGNTNPGTIQFNCENNSHGQQLKPQAHSVGSSAVHTLPNVTGELMPGKIEGTNFTDSLLVGHATTGTLDAAEKNTGVGINALDALTSGDSNTAIGRNAGSSVTSGYSNTYIGQAAGNGSTTSRENVAIGDSALKTVTTGGHENTAVGFEALELVNSGDHNVGIGYKAGDSLTSGKGNVLIGSNVEAASNTGDRQLTIGGYDGTTTTTWISGDSSGNLTFAGDITVGDDLNLTSDASVINFGADSDVTITHDADDGLVFKSAATADDNPFLLTLQTGETDIAANDVLGAINFQAPDEGTGTDAILVAAGIEAVSEGDFAADNNATKLSFKTAASAAAAETMSLSSTGLLTIADDLMIKDGGTIGVASTNDALTISSAGLLTVKDDLVIKSGGTIGGGGDTDLLTLGSAILTVAGEVQMTTLDIGGTNVTSTAAELNIVDGGTSATSTTLVDADRFVVNDNGTMVQVAASDLTTYINANANFASVGKAIAMAIVFG